MSLEGSLVFCVLTGRQWSKLLTNPYQGLTQGGNHLILQRGSSFENHAVKSLGQSEVNTKWWFTWAFQHGSGSHTRIHQSWEQLYPIDWKMCSCRSKYFHNKRLLSECAGTTLPMSTQIPHAPYSIDNARHGAHLTPESKRGWGGLQACRYDPQINKHSSGIR